MKLLVVEDDLDLCAKLREFFRESGFPADFEHGGEAGLARLHAAPYDLIIVDTQLPGADGFDVLKTIRRKSNLPVMMLTEKTDQADRVRGLRLGADDCLSKPFDTEELLARVLAILRRAASPLLNAPDAIEAGDLRLLPGSREAYFRGKQLDLTVMECEILECLMRSYGNVVSRDQLSLRLYNRPATPYDRSVDTHVSRIRRKMGDGRALILSVRGTGYQLRASC